jgi:hypothetical protein
MESTLTMIADKFTKIDTKTVRLLIDSQRKKSLLLVERCLRNQVTRAETRYERMRFEK